MTDCLNIPKDIKDKNDKKDYVKQNYGIDVTDDKKPCDNIGVTDATCPDIETQKTHDSISLCHFHRLSRESFPQKLLPVKLVNFNLTKYMIAFFGFTNKNEKIKKQKKPGDTQEADKDNLIARRLTKEQIIFIKDNDNIEVSEEQNFAENNYIDIYGEIYKIIKVINRELHKTSQIVLFKELSTSKYYIYYNCAEPVIKTKVLKDVAKVLTTENIETDQFKIYVGDPERIQLQIKKDNTQDISTKTVLVHKQLYKTYVVDFIDEIISIIIQDPKQTILGSNKKPEINFLGYSLGGGTCQIAALLAHSYLVKHNKEQDYTMDVTVVSSVRAIHKDGFDIMHDNNISIVNLVTGKLHIPILDRAKLMFKSKEDTSKEDKLYKMRVVKMKIDPMTIMVWKGATDQTYHDIPLRIFVNIGDTVLNEDWKDGESISSMLTKKPKKKTEVTDSNGNKPSVEVEDFDKQSNHVYVLFANMMNKVNLPSSKILIYLAQIADLHLFYKQKKPYEIIYKKYGKAS
jgi:hypothetical protein